MNFDLIQIRKLAKQKEDENWEFRAFLKTRSDSGEIDRRASEIARRVWAGIDCTSCANCCRSVKPSFSEEEVDRLAARLGMTRRQFVDSYLEQNDDRDGNPWRTRATPCPFLKGNLCSVYEDRPADCSGYPYVYEPRFNSRTMAMIGRTYTCPIVYELMEDLKKSFKFKPRRRR